MSSIRKEAEVVLLAACCQPATCCVEVSIARVAIGMCKKGAGKWWQMGRDGISTYSANMLDRV